MDFLFAMIELFGGGLFERHGLSRDITTGPISITTGPISITTGPIS